MYLCKTQLQMIHYSIKWTKEEVEELKGIIRRGSKFTTKFLETDFDFSDLK